MRQYIRLHAWDFILASHSEQPAQNEVVQKAEKMLEMANDDEDIL